MNARPGRPPKKPTGPTSTITVRLPADIKEYLIESSEALDISITDFLVALIRRDRGD